MIPIAGRASSFLEFFLFLKIQSQSKLNQNQNQIHSFFCSSFFLCLQGQLELYDLLQSCFSFFVRPMANLSRLVAASFSSLALLSSSVSTANLNCLVTTTFFSLSFNSFSSHRCNLLRVARRCFSWFSFFLTTFSFPLVSFWFSFLLYHFCTYLSLSFLCSSVSEALFTLSFSFLSERLFVFSSMLKLL